LSDKFDLIYSGHEEFSYITSNLVMLSVVVLSLLALNVVMLSVVVLSVLALNVVMLSVVILGVVAPHFRFGYYWKLNKNLPQMPIVLRPVACTIKGLGA
jgi:hypothetical protein